MGYTDLDAVYNEYRAAELDDLNETFVDILISKFDEFMKSYNWVKQGSLLGKKLQNKKLFRRDVKTVVSYVTPILPFLGLVEGGAVVVSEILENKYDSNDSCEVAEGGEQSETTTEPDQHEEQERD